MIKHLFSLIWKRKRKDFLLLLQLTICFVALFIFFGINVKKFTNYFLPLYYNYERVWHVEVDWENLNDEERLENLRLVKQKLQSIEDIETVSNTSTIPFSNDIVSAKFKVDNTVTQVRSYSSDENFAATLMIPLLKGRWFNREDLVLRKTPIVITRRLAEQHFGLHNDPINKTVYIDEKESIIVGICENFRINVSDDVEPSFFKPINESVHVGKFLLRTKHANDFLLLEDKLRNEIIKATGSNTLLRQNASLDLIKKYAHKMDYIQMTLALIIFGFLALNISLGISGVFSYNLSKRKAEVGLREAIGATRLSIVKQFLGEAIMLTTLGIIPGIIIAAQLLITAYFAPYLTIVSGILGMAGAALFLYTLMILCALYPSLRVSKTHPAEALHEE